MGSLRSRGCLRWLAILLAAAITSCGGHKPPGISPFPVRVIISPSTSISLQQGNTINFTASAQNGSGSVISTPFTFVSSDTTILNLSPTGVACAGTWDALYSICTPAGTGAVTVTAYALGNSSPPTYVFVHPPIDNITVTGILLDGVPIQEPCLSQGQSMTVEAHAFSHGTDITATVGTFTWSLNNPRVATVVPIINQNFNVATNQATVGAAFPGITQVYAQASGVFSNSFQQPQYTNSAGATSPVLDFFETCPIQNIKMELGHVGSGLSSFITSKGTSQNAFATVTDVMGNSSLPNTVNAPVLKPTLVWSATAPGVVSAATACTVNCALSTPSAGAGSVTASCTPPTCNIGFPYAPPVLSTPECAEFFNVSTCESFIPVPVYATTAISGLVQGSPTIPTVLATSMGCALEPPANCFDYVYDVALAKSQVGAPIGIPTAPNSFLFDPAGDKVYMGSDFGAEAIAAGNLGSTNSAFTLLGTVTGKILAVSNDGTMGLFTDTLHTPNQAYLVNSGNVNNLSIIPLSIAGASAAGFSPDELKAYIFGFDSNSNPNLYIYSSQQALQTIPLASGTTVSSFAFSTNSAFAYLVQSSIAGGGPGVTVYNTCNNAVATSPASVPQVIPLTATPIVFRALPDGVHFIALETNGSIDYITATITGIPPATMAQPASSICPMFVSHTLQNFNLQQGKLEPINFFPSADGSLLYVLASDRSTVLVFNFASNSVNGIPLVNNATPVSVGMSIDDQTIVVAGSDGMLHQITTSVGGSDVVQLPFPDLPDFLNPFCNFTPSTGPCTLNAILVRP